MELFVSLNDTTWNLTDWRRLGAGDLSLQDPCYHLLEILDFFHTYYIPTIIFFGLVGNFLSCVVFLNTHLKLRSSSYYLAALAMADFGFLVSLLLVWLNNNVGVQVFNRDGWCQGLVYASSVCSFLSVWLIVAFTVERFIAIQYPLHRPHMCTVTRAKAIVGGLAGIALLSHCYSFITAGLIWVDGVQICDLREGYDELMRVINIVDSLLTLILPLALILVMNVMITRNLIKFSRRFKQHEGYPGSQTGNRSDLNLNQLNVSLSSSSNGRRGGVSQPHSSQQHSSRIHHSVGAETPARGHHAPVEPAPSRYIHVSSSSRNLVSTKTQQSITKMLLLISTVFVLLNLPSYVIRLYIFVCFSLWRQTTPASLWCLQQFFMLLYYTNFSVNFLLYSMCGITFRRCLWQLLRNRLKSVTKITCHWKR